MRERRMARIRRTSQIMKYVTFVAVMTLASCYVAAFLWPGAADVVTKALTNMDEVPALTAGQLLLIFTLGSVPFGLYLAAIATAGQLFGAFHQGDVLTSQTGSLLAQIGLCILAAQLATVFATAAASGYVSHLIGEPEIIIAITSNDIANTLFGALLLVVGWVIAEAAEVAAENRQFV
ncbi:MAG: hypothetical protein AAGF45_12210 [Pseudomonadota bacterium]